VITGPALLFCPGDRPDRFGKAAAAGDSVIIDLEDAVSLAAKDAAREALIASDLDPDQTLVRVNSPRSGLLEADLEALRRTPYRRVVLPKAETREDLVLLANYEVMAICESPLGVRNAELLADLDDVGALAWGAEDLVAAMGGSSSRDTDGSYREFARYARSRMLIAARSAGKAAFDTVHLDIPDREGLRAEATDAAASGFTGTMCIHPSQVEIIRSAFQPTGEAIAWARGVLRAASEASNAVFAYEDRMIDEPVLRQARKIVAGSPITE
jgi:citrate lyase subunit beta/citryl-CoA lyase